jgi:hypothetical protein
VEELPTEGIASCRDFSHRWILIPAAVRSLLTVLITFLWLTAPGLAQAAAQSPDSTNIFAPASTPADSIHKLSLLVLAVTGTWSSLAVTKPYCG